MKNEKMLKVTVNGTVYHAEKGTNLKDFFIKNNIKKQHPCGGMGVCRKCLATVNGKEELSCRYVINSDVSVKINEDLSTVFDWKKNKLDNHSGNLCFCLDLGTTGIVLALVDIDSKKIIDIKKSHNPQRIYGADVISRIAFCEDNGTDKMQAVIINEVNRLVSSYNLSKKVDLYVSANTVMLHIFAGINPEKMGKAPYSPDFLGFKYLSGSDLGFGAIEKITLLPSISAFVGADLVSGLNAASTPPKNKYNLLVDLGTNAEIILYSQDNVFCTSAAAGPCFEGTSISQGMTASEGAIYEYNKDGEYSVIGNRKPTGICGTGFIDIIAVLLKIGIINESGYMDCKKYEVAPDIFITDEDIRQIQLAKAAVKAGILTLMHVHKVSFDHIETLYISGGFSEKININNAVRIGLIPHQLKSKTKNIDNSSLTGVVKYATEKNDLLKFTENAIYTDLATNDSFLSFFVEGMGFTE